MLCVLPNCPLEGPNAFLYELALEFVTTGIGESNVFLFGKTDKSRETDDATIMPPSGEKTSIELIIYALWQQAQKILKQESIRSLQYNLYCMNKYFVLKINSKACS
jgi:hypothetical protein